MDLAAEHGNGLFANLRGIRSEAELRPFLHQTAHDFGFAYFTILTIPPASQRSLQPQVAIASYPLGFIEDYDRSGLLRNSAIFANLRRSTVPLAWSRGHQERNRPAEENPLLEALLDKYHITMGVFFPVHGPDGNRAAVGFGGDRPPLSHREESELALLAIHAYDLFASLTNRHAKDRQCLSARELEVLSWVANGKTSSEVAAILSLSDHTINTYINTAMRKLDCVNRTQLVAKALRLHLID